jgi:hypothetical protein
MNEMCQDHTFLLLWGSSRLSACCKDSQTDETKFEGPHRMLTMSPEEIKVVWDMTKLVAKQIAEQTPSFTNWGPPAYQAAFFTPKGQGRVFGVVRVNIPRLEKFIACCKWVAKTRVHVTSTPPWNHQERARLVMDLQTSTACLYPSYEPYPWHPWMPPVVRTVEEDLSWGRSNGDP